MRGRAFTLIIGSNAAVFGIAMAVGGALVDVVGPRWLWAGAAVIMACATVIGSALARRVQPPRRVVPVPLPAKPESPEVSERAV